MEGTIQTIPWQKPLEIADEALVTLIIGRAEIKITCTLGYLRELAMGFIVSEGIVKRDAIARGQVRVNVNNDRIGVEMMGSSMENDVLALGLRSSGSPGMLYEAGDLPRVCANGEFSIEDCRDALQYLNTDEYQRTRAYHSATLVGKGGMIARASDIGRHNAIDKVVGMGMDRGVDFQRVFLLTSGRLSRGMAAKCVRSGIPLLVSKAAILASAVNLCVETGLSAVSFTSGVAIRGKALNI